VLGLVCLHHLFSVFFLVFDLEGRRDGKECFWGIWRILPYKPNAEALGRPNTREFLLGSCSVQVLICSHCLWMNWSEIAAVTDAVHSSVDSSHLSVVVVYVHHSLYIQAVPEYINICLLVGLVWCMYKARLTQSHTVHRVSTTQPPRLYTSSLVSLATEAHLFSLLHIQQDW